jgi:hypothetical protein
MMEQLLAGKTVTGSVGQQMLCVSSTDPDRLEGLKTRTGSGFWITPRSLRAGQGIPPRGMPWYLRMAWGKEKVTALRANKPLS